MTRRMCCTTDKKDIKSCSTSNDLYPSSEEISCIEQAISFLPESLKLLLELMFVDHDKEIKVASIGQAIMQAVRPRVLIAPLQLGLGGANAASLWF